MTGKKILMVLCASLLHLVCYAKEPLMSDTKTYCVGRYLVDLPADAEINGQAYDYAFGRIDSEHTDLNAQGFAATMQQRAEELRAVDEKKGRSLKGVVTAGPNAEVLVTSEKIYGDDNYGFEAYRLAENRLFTMKKLDMDQSVWEKKILPRLRDQLLPNLRTRKSTDIPAESGFCLKDGFIADEGKVPQYESAGISFKFSKWPGVLVTVQTMTVTKLGEPKLLKRLDSGDVPAQFKNLVSSIHTIRRGERPINGRVGEEDLSTIPTDLGYRIHQFRWEAQGNHISDSLEPTLVVELESGMTRDGDGNPARPRLTDEQAAAVFDAVSNSLRFRSGGSRTVTTSEVGPSPALPLGTLARTGTLCPQTGWWTCPEAVGHQLDGGGRQFFAAGSVLPVANVMASQSFIDRLRGTRSRYAVNTVWQLVEYERPAMDVGDIGLSSGGPVIPTGSRR